MKGLFTISLIFIGSILLAQESKWNFDIQLEKHIQDESGFFRLDNREFIGSSPDYNYHGGNSSSLPWALNAGVIRQIGDINLRLGLGYRNDNTEIFHNCINCNVEAELAELHSLEANLGLIYNLLELGRFHFSPMMSLGNQYTLKNSIASQSDYLFAQYGATFDYMLKNENKFKLNISRLRHFDEYSQLSTFKMNGVSFALGYEF